MDSSAISRALVMAYAIIPFISATRWTSAALCPSGAYVLYEGDFNGDGRMDILCHTISDGYMYISFANADGQFVGNWGWRWGWGWCYGVNQEIHIGDFNGDGKYDMLCHDKGDGRKWIAHANSAGTFADGTTWEADLGWCFHRSAELHIGDFDGDGRYDMLCHNTSNGHKWIAHASFLGNFARGTTWEADLGWCNHSGAELHIGDFNGDSKDDMLCHNSNNGYKWISYANCDGNFSGGTDWEEAMKWCYYYGAELHIGDSNGDGKDDMFCHDTGDGYLWLALANGQNNFHYGTTWEARLEWCYTAGHQLFLGDYDGDSMTDLMCNTATGVMYVIYTSPPYE